MNKEKPIDEAFRKYAREVGISTHKAAFKAGFIEASKAVETQQGWMDVTPETMPKIPSYVLVTNGGYCKAVWYGVINGKFTYINDDGETDYVDNATHYMYVGRLPKPTTKLKIMIALLISLVLWSLIFSVIYWGLSQVALPPPFNMVIRVVLVVAVVIVLIGLLMGSIAPFPVLQNL